MYQKTARNAYSSMVRATVVFDREEMFEHFKWWQRVLADMPESVFAAMPANQGKFCRLIVSNNFEKALKYWKRTRLIGKLADLVFVRPYTRLKKLIMQCKKMVAVINPGNR